MQDSAKYLIHADIRASGVVERSDVVGAIFGQTEGLLGDELDLRDLQESSKVGRIDVQIESEGGRSYGTVTIASGLDKVETAVLAAGLETIDRVGPCRAEFEVTELEDARAAKRRAVVERATDLLAEFEESTLSSQELVEEVRQNVRVEHISEYEGFPAGPRVADSDAIIVVEGRADVLTLLQYGIKNAIAVEGTDVPDAVAALTHDRTVTAFLDGDRGGDLILKELSQVGNVDYVTFAPEGRSVEDLSRSEVFTALRKKARYEEVADHSSPHEYLSADAATEPTPPPDDAGPDETEPRGSSVTAADEERIAEAVAAVASSGSGTTGDTDVESPDTPTTETPEQVTPAVERVDPSEESATMAAEASPPSSEDASTPRPDETGPPETLAGHVEAVVGGDTGNVRLLDETLAILDDVPASEAFDAIESAETVPTTVVLDGQLDQRVLDVAAQRGVDQIVAASTGEFVKRPTGVRIRTTSEF